MLIKPRRLFAHRQSQLLAHRGIGESVGPTSVGLSVPRTKSDKARLKSDLREFRRISRSNIDLITLVTAQRLGEDWKE